MTDRSPVSIELDHLVVGAATLEQGAAWCEATFGVTPGPGGQHVFMGTHNRLVRLDGGHGLAPRDAYLEIIAIDPHAAVPSRPRWFGLDDAAVRAALARGPRLLHWVARSADPAALRARWAAAGLDPGPVEAAERATPRGPLRWKLTIPADGRPPAGGTVPTLIAWDGPHPAPGLDPTAVLRLTALRWSGDAALGVRLDPADATGPQPSQGAPRLQVRLEGPGGVATLDLPAPG